MSTKIILTFTPATKWDKVVHLRISEPFPLPGLSSK